MIYKIANTIEEYEQIFKLNYETFVDEIPQHEKNDTKKLKDKFHDKNIYIIAKKESEVIGMISLSDTRPFSLDLKLENIDKYYKGSYKKPVEIRLLSIKPQYRKSKVFNELIQRTFNYIIQNAYDIIFISGTTRQEKLYKHLGFVKFHENVGTKEAEYMPMYLDLTKENRIVDRLAKAQRINFLPGPVDLSNEVIAKLSKQLYSHRSNEFVSLTKNTLSKIEKIIDVKCATILHGSATLANEAIMAQLKGRNLLNGLVLANGEFGNRLIRETKRHGLNVEDYSVSFGESFDLEFLDKKLSEKRYDFVYLVHNETSVGILNDLEEITKIAKAKNVVIAVDAVSAVGAVKYSYKDVDYVACSSGKAFCSVAGLAIVGTNCDLVPLENTPLYLDLHYAHKMTSIPFTQPSILMEALNTALDAFKTDERYEKVQSKYSYMKEELKILNLPIMKIKKKEVSPVIITVELPKEISSLNVGESFAINNIFIHYKSSYLQERNIIQFSFININTTKKEIDYTLNILKEMIGEN
ncbi:aminotransferase class V-fold PLP-dependent enzyme [Gemella cuniculi]|uniref:aminotransferase class V-fold PLP-dependent enzyme n=1 Tax=Gemella cuniculi TaxID=150240 RepID=UPI0003FFCED9|nr:aminotransferase class V-fold PLP-dependent enzyme [Gemella cuniculi]